MDSFPPNKTIGMGIFVALILLGLMGFAFFNNTPGSPPATCKLSDEYSYESTYENGDVLFHSEPLAVRSNSSGLTGYRGYVIIFVRKPFVYVFMSKFLTNFFFSASGS